MDYWTSAEHRSPALAGRAYPDAPKASKHAIVRAIRRMPESFYRLCPNSFPRPIQFKA